MMAIKYTFLMVALTVSHPLLAQTISLECDLEGKYIQYKGGKIQKQESADGVKEKIKRKYYVSISDRKISWNVASNPSDKGDIDENDNNSRFKSNSIARWEGHSFIASYYSKSDFDAYLDTPAHSSSRQKSWQINRMNGKATFKESSSITPVVERLYTSELEVSGFCKTATPKF